MQLISNEALPFGVGALTLTMILSFFLGLERHLHLKGAGVKTHALVGTGSCLSTPISIYGFVVPETSTLTLDPSRLAAQIVSGTDFLGTGVIFANNNTARGLTTAATVWFLAAIGVTCGARLGVLAVTAPVLHFLLIFAIGPPMEKIPSSHRNDRMIIEYESIEGVMRKILVVASEYGCAALVKSTKPIQTENGAGMRVVLQFEGPYLQDALIKESVQIEDITAVDRAERAEFD